MADGFWSIWGAIIGAFLGAFFGFIVSIYLDFRRSAKLKIAFYNEVEFLSTYISDFLVSVVKEYEMSKIDIGNGSSFSGPINIDFVVLNTLHLELYKTRSIPTDDCRKLVHNISSRWDSICSFDIERIKKEEGETFYKVDRAKCMEIVFSSISLLYYLEKLVLQRGKFKFDDVSFKIMAETVFNKYHIKNDRLINEINKQRPY